MISLCPVLKSNCLPLGMREETACGHNLLKKISKKNNVYIALH